MLVFGRCLDRNSIRTQATLNFFLVYRCPFKKLPEDYLKRSQFLPSKSPIYSFNCPLLSLPPPHSTSNSYSPTSLTPSSASPSLRPVIPLSLSFPFYFVLLFSFILVILFEIHLLILLLLLLLPVLWLGQLINTPKYLVLNLELRTDYSESCFSCYLSFLPGRRRDNTV
jgi:hypothetical protein